MSYDSHQNGVCILFNDADIADVFQELLASRGIPSTQIVGVEDLPQEASVITEPSFVTQIPYSMHSKCLVVGNRGALEGLQTLCLSRPLTEEKVETALRTFIERTSPTL